MNSFLTAAKKFASDEEGAQVIEYALIIAVVSIVLVVALSNLADSGGDFEAFIDKVGGCLKTGSACTA